ncbi:MAG: acetyl-CoA C-acyltransferase [Bacteroidia bacterium]
MKQVFVVSAVRTPIGSFGGAFKDLTAVQLGAAAIRGALARAGVEASLIEEVIMGNVVSANLGQAPARQAAILAGLSEAVPCTTVNKVCASGMKAIMLAAQGIMTGQTDLAVAGGMESMTNAPYYLPKARYGYGFGNGTLIDGMSHDGLIDAYDGQAMGVHADGTARDLHISREAQDTFAIQSYQRSAASTAAGLFRDEIVPVEVPQRKGPALLVQEDEEYKKVFFDKIPGLKPAFTPDGTVTAANASTINDGASALVLASEEKVRELNLTPVARIVSFADAAQAPKYFTTAPAKAAPIALKRAGLSLSDIDYFEVNEAFSVVTLAFNQLLDLDPTRVNVHGGAVSLGHPLGCSGARIVTTLNGVLQQRDARLGLAAICNGGGGASALILEKI